MSNGPDITSIGKTLTNGIQDISALLPLLGTEQCEQHIGSGLTGGYLYVAATPMSIFGSLGMARAGFKGLLASIAVQNWRFVGAEKLRDIGFTPSGKNLSLIMIDPDNGCHLAETRLDSLLKDLHIENVERLSVSVSCDAWNFKMLVFTAAFCILGVTPYIHLITNKNNLPRFACWALPVIRTLGGFLTATSLQVLMQKRLMVILNNRLRFHAVNHAVRSQLFNELRDDIPFQWDLQIPSEKCLWNLEQVLSSKGLPHALRRTFHSLRTALGDRAKDDTYPNHFAPGKESSDTLDSAPWSSRGSADLESKGSTSQQIQDDVLQSLAEKFARVCQAFPINITVWPFLVLVFFGISISVVGYIGCFTVVQGSQHANVPLVWLCLEGVLSMIRMALWGWNPKFQCPDPVEITFALNKFVPLSTVNYSYEELRSWKILPFVRAPEFLESITSYAGLLKRFHNPNISLFYTLIRKASHCGPEVRERLLYIILFDHREHVTRVYTEDNGDPIFFETEPLLTLEEDKPQRALHDSTVLLKDRPLQIRVRGIIDPSTDSLVADERLRTMLRVHYRSIVDQLQFRIRNPCRSIDIIENSWTLKYTDTRSAIGRDAAQQIHRGSRNNIFSEIACQEHDLQDQICRPEHCKGDAANVICLEEQDDVDYVRQGALQRKRQELFWNRRTQIDYYASDDRKKTSQVLKIAKSQMTIHQSEVAVLKKILSRMMAVERVILEAIVLKEMREWEHLLFESYHSMSKAIAKKQKADWGIEMLERRLAEEWAQGSQVRLIGDMRRHRERGDLKQWTDDFFGLFDVEEIKLDMEVLSSELQRDVARELMVIHQSPYSGRSRVWPLKHLILSYRKLLQTNLDQVTPKMSAASRKFLKERKKAMTRRLSLEEQNMRRRIRNMRLAKCFCSLEHSFEGIVGSASHSNPISISKQWVKIEDHWADTSSISCPHGDPSTPFWRDMLPTLRRTKWINIIQAGDRFGLDSKTDKTASELEILQGVIEFAKDKSTSLTTILLEYRTLEKEMVAALKDAIKQNPNILSIDGPDPQLQPLKAALEQRRLTINSTSLTTYGFYMAWDKIKYTGQQDMIDISWSEWALCSYCGGGDAKIELRFIAPENGALILRLRHRQSGIHASGQAVQIHGKSTLTCVISPSEEFVMTAIELIPSTHFDPGAPALLSIVPLLQGYELQSIDLLDEDGTPYTVAPNKDHYGVADHELMWGAYLESEDQDANESAETTLPQRVARWTPSRILRPDVTESYTNDYVLRDVGT
ncbi:hypothetical protein Hypma_001888 [Hypsizygus marmoreus]|uniref:Uncharacterized protein n=1 Tax=Hypsizygus marmoreus TaxID=39966 RepID=A0A369J521_HYPMA|nr:hypothetical protein Hypma_001888 [Hypsizygus marmoreus]